jgi:protein-S-isoprenylcysteine O-methyltransferase Ste14
MNLELTIKIIILSLIFAFFLLRTKFTSHFKQKTKRTWIKYIASVILLLIYIPGFIDFALLPINTYIRIIPGCILIALGLSLFFSAHSHLRNNWSPIIEKKFSKSKTLVKTGPYKYIRHPIYTASLIALLGFGLLSANWLFFFIPLAILLTLYIKKIPKEEASLIKNFGKPYKEYMKSTGSLIPKI